MISNVCVVCPTGSTGRYVNTNQIQLNYSLIGKILCINFVYFGILGIYPNCKCNGENEIFSAHINQCYVECGADSIGLHPHCQCDSYGTYYDVAEFACKTNIGRKCPPKSIGIGPDCLCAEANTTFVDFFWDCYLEGGSFAHYPQSGCPDKSQKWPQCSGIDPNALRSLVG